MRSHGNGKLSQDHVTSRFDKGQHDICDPESDISSERNETERAGSRRQKLLGD
jgi:hypothetical protein